MTHKTMIIVLAFVLIFAFACDKPQALEQEKKKSAMQKSQGESKMVFKPVVAGQFYSGDAKKLSAEVDSYIAQAEAPKIDGKVMGIISPHAGYIFSGPVAGYSFKAVQGKKYDVVVVMGLSHRVPGSISVLDFDAYRTPLGDVTINRELSQKIINAASWIDNNEQLFALEHSLEVQLPFVQRALPNTPVVMISMRSQSLVRCTEFAKILDTVFSGVNALFVASSDMSHFHDYDTAKKMDLKALDLLDDLNVEGLVQELAQGKCEMCGSGPVLTLSELYKLRGGNADGAITLKYMNSGDTAGDKGRVVGYGAVAFTLPDDKKEMKSKTKSSEDYLSDDEKKTLLGIARKTVESYISKGDTPKFDIKDENLKKDGAAFVTLHKHGQLRGCIGQILARGPLWECVRDMAIAAASQDPRFPKVGKSEVPKLHIEISVLTPPKVIKDVKEVEVGRHGLIMSRGFQKGLLLPQVPVEWKWDRKEFLANTCMKAGMGASCWEDPDTKIETFEAIVFSE